MEREHIYLDTGADAVNRDKVGRNRNILSYNADGLRTKKTVGGTTTEYFWIGDQLYSRYNSSQKMAFWYDGNGSIAGFTLNGTRYYYEKNLQGDIISVLDANYNQVAKVYV